MIRQSALTDGIGTRRPRPHTADGYLGPVTRVPPLHEEPHALDRRAAARPLRPPGPRHGSHSGIGFVISRELARHGAEVVLAVRDTDAGDAAAERIRRAGIRGDVVVERLDLASLESVRALADRFDGTSTSSSTTPG